MKATMNSAQGTLKSALHQNKFCKTMFDKLCKDRGANHELYLYYSSTLADECKLSESLSVLCFAIQNFSANITNGQIFPLVSKIIECLRQECSVYDIVSHHDPLSCPSCCGILADPVTLLCGHTYCKVCLFRTQKKVCKICQTKIRSDDLSHLFVNVLISSLVEKWFKREAKVVLLRNKANKFFQERQFLKALNTYTEAVKKAPEDHLLLSNRSHALHALGLHEEALRDGNEVIKLHPEWGKGHYRRANALCALGRDEEALESLLICAVLETTSDLESISCEITKVLRKVMKQNNQKLPSEIFSKHFGQQHLDTSDLSHSNITNSHKIKREKLLNSLKKISATKTIDLQLNQEEVSAMSEILKNFSRNILKIKNSTSFLKRTVDPVDVQKEDFECALCYHYLWEPITTPCGHTFCRSCLDRSLDHAIHCPLCKMSLKEFLAKSQSNVNEFIEYSMKMFVPNEYREREIQHEQEMNEFAKAGKDLLHEIPIFVATLAIPSITCPLHVFEPRYRLMIRRVMEAGTREFGMCMPSRTEENGYQNYGTMLEVREVTPFYDGRRLVTAVGSRRFKCINKGTKDGYNTATVEYLKDEEIPESELAAVKQLHDSVYQRGSDWFNSLGEETKRRIICHYGVMPDTEDRYWSLSNGPVWLWWLVAILPLESVIRLRILKETRLQVRLNLVSQILRCVRQYQSRMPE